MNGWNIIQTFMFPQDAYMAKAYLESAGINTLIQDEMTTQTYSLYSNAIGGVKLLVPDADVAESRRLLTEGGYLIPADQEKEEDWVWAKKTKDTTHCPFCHSDNIAKMRSVSIAAVILYFILGVLFPLFRPVIKCYDCGKAWKWRKE